MSSPNLNPPDDATTGPVDDAMTGLRAAVEQQLGVERPEHLVIEPEACQRFAADLAGGARSRAPRRAARARGGAAAVAAGAVLARR